MIASFSQWLQETQLSQAFIAAGWVVPTAQSFHIVCISIVMASSLLLNLRLLQVVHHPLSVADMARRFLPWIWWALLGLACSGLFLIVSEPNREFLNVLFWIKMGLVALSIPLTFTLQTTLARDETFWSSTARRRVFARVLAAVAFCLWLAILSAGRWIAYIQAPTG